MKGSQVLVLCCRCWTQSTTAAATTEPRSRNYRRLAIAIYLLIIYWH